MHTQWATEEGVSGFRISILKRLNDSKDHRRAGQKQRALAASEDSADSSTGTCEDEALFVIVYHAAISKMPSSEANGLLTLQRRTGVKMQYQNLSWQSITDIQASICSTLAATIVEQLQSAKAFSIM